jgi:hypothetical protein
MERTMIEPVLLLKMCFWASGQQRQIGGAIKHLNKLAHCGRIDPKRRAEAASSSASLSGGFVARFRVSRGIQKNLPCATHSIGQRSTPTLITGAKCKEKISKSWILKVTLCQSDNHCQHRDCKGDERGKVIGAMLVAKSTP